MGVPRGSSSRQRTSFYTEPRHLPSTLEDWEADGSPDPEAQEWRIRSTRTYGGVLAVCLNVELSSLDTRSVRPLVARAGNRRPCGFCARSRSKDWISSSRWCGGELLADDIFGEMWLCAC